jgi:hypothetical protein
MQRRILPDTVPNPKAICACLTSSRRTVSVGHELGGGATPSSAPASPAPLALPASVILAPPAVRSAASRP